MIELRPFEVDRADQLLLGALAVHFTLVTKEELGACLARQTATEGTRLLGDVLVEAGHLDEEQRDHLLLLQAFLRTRHADRRFAGRVLETGYITEDEVAYAFKAQETAYARDRDIRSISDLLVEFGSIDEELRDELRHPPAEEG